MSLNCYLNNIWHSTSYKVVNGKYKIEIFTRRRYGINTVRSKLFHFKSMQILNIDLKNYIAFKYTGIWK
jgi:hypothetical protein